MVQAVMLLVRMGFRATMIEDFVVFFSLTEKMA
jgi:hypothetical protein